jgi:hypothetical protein
LSSVYYKLFFLITPFAGRRREFAENPMFRWFYSRCIMALNTGVEIPVPFNGLGAQQINMRQQKTIRRLK